MYLQIIISDHDHFNYNFVCLINDAHTLSAMYPPILHIKCL